MVFTTNVVEYYTEDECELGRERTVEFAVSNEWFEEWFDKNRKGDETNGFIDKSTYETPHDFLNDYVWDDSWQMYLDAKDENAIIEETPLGEWSGI